LGRFHPLLTAKTHHNFFQDIFASPLPLNRALPLFLALSGMVFFLITAFSVAFSPLLFFRLAVLPGQPPLPFLLFIPGPHSCFFPAVFVGWSTLLQF